MASRQLAVQQQNIGEAQVQGAIRQKNMEAAAGGGGKTYRQALGDIGNLVPVRELVGKQVCLPVTKDHNAQILANSKAELYKNPLAAIGNEANGCTLDKKPLARNPVQIKDVGMMTPKPNRVEENNQKAVEKSSKTKNPTLTSTLTARSKAACGLSNKPKACQIADIDATDANNDLAVVEYVEEMYMFYKSVENEGRAYNNYMDSQPEINENMRAILIDWLVQVHDKFELSQETLYLTINIVDRYLASKMTLRKELQLVGISAILIASKYEEIWAPEVYDLVCISDNTYSNEQVLMMEKRILGALEWYLTVPTPYVFLVRFIKASMTDSDVENMVYFLAELGMMNYEILIHCPSKIAASAVYAARFTLNKAPFWNETLQKHTGFSEQELMDCAKMLVNLHVKAHEQKLKGIYRKYSSSAKRSVTKDHNAQILANSKAELNKNPSAAIGNEANGCRLDKKPLARTPVQIKAVSIKPKPNGVEENYQKAVEKSSKMKNPTPISTLTARSKAAFGLSNKPKACQIVDIDASDANNDLAVIQYVEEMYMFYKSVENEGRAYNNYMDSQPEINEKMRAILIDWLVQVHHKFELSQETLYLTINIVDRYLASNMTLRKELQLVGISAILIASKYEEIWAPEVNDLVCISDNTYSNEQVLMMEKRILGALEWYLTIPTPYVFLVRFIKASMTDSDVENMVYFLAELGMMNYETLIYCPSKIAASAVYAARCTLNKAPFWNETLEKHTSFSEQELMDCAKMLVNLHVKAREHNLKGIYRKYSSCDKRSVAVLPPAISLVDVAI